MDERNQCILEIMKLFNCGYARAAHIYSGLLAYGKKHKAKQ